MIIGISAWIVTKMNEYKFKWKLYALISGYFAILSKDRMKISNIKRYLRFSSSLDLNKCIYY
jgi:hypothetical protein